MTGRTVPALVGGSALGVVSGLPVVQAGNCACCAWVIGRGVLAGYLHSRGLGPREAPPYREALGVGALTGLFGFLVMGLVSLPFFLLGARDSLFGVKSGSFDLAGPWWSPLPSELQDAAVIPRPR